jgi:hypothetical protein
VQAHDLSPEQAAARKAAEATAWVRQHAPHHVLGFRLPSDAAKEGFDGGEYLDAYPVPDPRKRLVPDQRHALLRMLSEADRLAVAKGRRGQAVLTDTPLMALIRHNFARVANQQATGQVMLVRDLLRTMGPK